MAVTGWPQESPNDIGLSDRSDHVSRGWCLDGLEAHHMKRNRIAMYWNLIRHGGSFPLYIRLIRSSEAVTRELSIRPLLRNGCDQEAFACIIETDWNGDTVLYATELWHWPKRKPV